MCRLTRTAHTGIRCTPVKKTMKRTNIIIIALIILSINKSYSQDLHGSLKVLTYIKGCHGSCNYSYSDFSDINNCGTEKDSIIEVINVFRITGAYYINGKLISSNKADTLLNFINTNKSKIIDLANNVIIENNAEFIPPDASCFEFEEYQFYMDKYLISFIVIDGDKNENGSFLKNKDLEIFDNLKTLIK